MMTNKMNKQRKMWPLFTILMRDRKPEEEEEEE